LRAVPSLLITLLPTPEAVVQAGLAVELRRIAVEARLVSKIPAFDLQVRRSKCSERRLARSMSQCDLVKEAPVVALANELLALGVSSLPTVACLGIGQ
jgi:hypothetical protein